MSWLVSAIPTQIVVDEFVIRRYEHDDAGTLVVAVTESVSELLPWMPWAQFEPQTVRQREELIDMWAREWDEEMNFTMGIFLGSTCVGGTGFHLRGDPGVLEIGYWVSTLHSRKGIVTRAVEALTSTAFTLPEVREVHIAHDVANIRSQRIPERLGFRMVSEYERMAIAPGELGRARVWATTRRQWNDR